MQGYTQVPIEVLRQCTLTEIKVYCAIKYYQRTNKVCYPSIAKIGEAMNLTTWQGKSAPIQKAIKGLEKKRFISVERKKGSVNIYSVDQSFFDKKSKI